jgi:hypothetical protein
MYFTDAEQAWRSTAVVVAQVGPVRASVHPRWGRPILLTTIVVQEVLLGEVPEQVEVEQFGLLEAEGSRVLPGDARLEPGDRCVLFLREVDGSWYLTAMGQSRYGLRPSKRGDLLERSLDMQLFLRDDLGALVPFEARPALSRSLASLRRLLAGVGGGELR